MMDNSENSSWFLNPIGTVVGTLLIIVIPILIWSKQASLEQISHATGTIIASAKTQSIQTAIDGIITQIDVQEGEAVKNGQELVFLNKQQNQAAFEAAKGKVAALKAALTRLKSEVYGMALEFPEELEDYPEFVNTQTELYHRRKKL